MLKFLKDENGSAAIEYALLVSLIAIVLIPTLSDIGEALEQVYLSILDKLEILNI